MSEPHADRNLLFGILALQMDFISRDALVQAMNAWVLDKEKPLGRVLVGQQALGEDEHALLEVLVQKHLQRHGNDPQKSLAVISSLASVRQDLEQVADPDVQASLAHIPAPRGAGEDSPPSRPSSQEPATDAYPHATEAYSLGSSSGSGLRFRILRPHARGGLGEVFVAEDEELHREVALKEIQSRHAHHPDSRSRFLLEAEVTGRLEHPGIVPVYGLGTYADGRPFYAMRFIKGDSLQEAIERFHRPGRGKDPGQRGLELRQLLGRFVDVCNAVAYAHSRGVLHRDLKPGNIMLGQYGETLVVDWGLAKMAGRSGAGADSTEAPLAPTRGSGVTPTQMGQAIGTPQYMSPEQAAGRLDELGPASDVYSLGSTLYALLTGRAPFAGQDLGTLLRQVQCGDFPPPRQINPDVPRPLEAVCLKAMALLPQDRYASARDLAGDVERWLADEPVAAYREPLSARLRRWGRRHRTLVSTSVALLLTVAVALAVSTVLVSGALQKEEQARGQAVEALKKEEQARKERALAQVNAVLDASPQAVPGILQGLEPLGEDVLPALRAAWEAKDTPHTRSRRMRAGLALLSVEPDRVKGPLFDWMLQVENPAEMLLVRDALRPHREGLLQALWGRAEDDRAGPAARFRALVVLAAFDPDSPRWAKDGGLAAEQLLEANPLHLGLWTEALRPVRGSLLGPLGEVFRGKKLAEKREVAATVLADYAKDRPDVLTDLIADADPKQYALLLPPLQRHREQAVARLRREIERSAAPDWHDRPLDPAWAQPAPALVQEIEKADGLVAERFALVQTLPLEQSGPVLEALRRSGYRPVRYRPYNVGPAIWVAAGWTRDGRDWQLAQDLSAAAVRGSDAGWRNKGYVPLDVAGYLDRSEAAGVGERYAALWVRKDADTMDARMYVGVPASRHQAAYAPLMKEGYVPRTQSQCLIGGQPLYSAVWWKPVKPSETNIYNYPREEAWYEGNLSPSNFQVDVRVARAAPLPAGRESAASALAQAQKDLTAKPGDLNALFRRAQAYYHLGQDERALADLNVLIRKATNPTFSGGHKYRALVHARLGRAAEARKDLAEFRKRDGKASTLAYLEALVAVHLGQDEAGLRRLEEGIATHARDTGFLYDAACAYSLAAAAVHSQNVGTVVTLTLEPSSPSTMPTVPLLLGFLDRERTARRSAYIDRAVALLEQAVAAGYSNYSLLGTDADLEPVRQHPGYLALVRKLHLDRRYSAVWHSSATQESAEAHGLDPATHLARCRELAAQGYRPAALSVAEVEPGQPLVTASVWHRPVVAEGDRIALASQQANGAAALLQLGDAERVWPLLQHSPYPDRRSYLVQRLAPLGIDATSLVQRLEEEQDVSARRTLVLALGEYTAEQMPAELRTRLVPRLLEWYRSDPDPGLHGAIDWLLRHAREGPEPRKFDWGQAAALSKADEEQRGKEPPKDRRWYVNQTGQTLAIFPGPVEFLMGSPGSEPGRDTDEKLHRRRIGRGFALATKPVTVAQFQKFLRAHPEVEHYYTKRYSPDPGGPIIGVTWYEAAQYCRWLSEQEGVPEDQMCYPPVEVIEKSKDGTTSLKLPADYLSRTGYRLPTEAEWEYACRADTRTSRSYGGGDDLLPRYAWYLANSQDRTWPVGQKRPNDFGLFDMHGNVWNWCQESAWPYQPGANGQPAEDEEDKRYIKDLLSRVLRGGSFLFRSSSVRSASRSGNRPADRSNNVGLRVARTCH
jgi:formylglycine-generating enzyme required for sulfatase activity/serine/threonine protein kinase